MLPKLESKSRNIGNIGRSGSRNGGISGTGHQPFCLPWFQSLLCQFGLRIWRETGQPF